MSFWSEDYLLPWSWWDQAGRGGVLLMKPSRLKLLKSINDRIRLTEQGEVIIINMEIKMLLYYNLRAFRSATINWMIAEQKSPFSMFDVSGSHG